MISAILLHIGIKADNNLENEQDVDLKKRAADIFTVIMDDTNVSLGDKYRQDTNIIILAAKKASTELAKVFRDTDSNISTEKNHACTTFIRAMCGDHVDVVKMIRNNEDSVWIIKFFLINAVKKSDLEMVKTLVVENPIASSIITEITEMPERTPYHPFPTTIYDIYREALKRRERNPEIADIIGRIQNIAVEGSCEYELIDAAQYGKLEYVKKCIKAGANINARSGDNYYRGQTALMCAAQRGYTDIVKILISAGADINLTDAFYKTAFFYAATSHVDDHRNCLNIMKILIANGDLTQNIEEFFLKAARTGNKNMVKALLVRSDRIKYNTLKTVCESGSYRDNIRKVVLEALNKKSQ